MLGGKVDQRIGTGETELTTVGCRVVSTLLVTLLDGFISRSVCANRVSCVHMDTYINETYSIPFHRVLGSNTVEVGNSN